jgi:hypothetical protein
MDAKAYTFYGYRKDLPVYPEHYNKLQRIGITYVRVTGGTFLAVEVTLQSFHWDNGAVPLDTIYLHKYFNDSSLIGNWNTSLERAVKLVYGEAFEEQKCCWLVLCDFS